MKSVSWSSEFLLLQTLLWQWTIIWDRMDIFYSRLSGPTYLHLYGLFALVQCKRNSVSSIKLKIFFFYFFPALSLSLSLSLSDTFLKCFPYPFRCRRQDDNDHHHIPWLILNGTHFSKILVPYCNFLLENLMNRIIILSYNCVVLSGTFGGCIHKIRGMMHQPPP